MSAGIPGVGCGGSAAARSDEATARDTDHKASLGKFVFYENSFGMTPDIIQFLIQVATEISKGKRQSGTDTDTVRESSKCLV